MNLNKCILTNNECYKTKRTIVPKGVMIHSTGANNTDLRRYVAPDDGKLGKNQYNNHWNSFRPDGRQICCHAFIGKLKDGTIATYQTLPWNHRGWHCAGSANNTHIGFEVCEDNLTNKAYFNKVYKEAVELTAYLCDMYKLDPLKDGVVICHAEGHKRGWASNHGDVLHWFKKHNKTMDDFRKAVAKQMSKSTVTEDNDFPYLVKINCATLNVMSGAGSTYKVSTVVKKGEVYTIVDEKDGWGKLKSGAGWIKLSYTTRK